MKILHITKHYPPYVGGIETVCKDMCDSLSGRADQVVLAFNDTNSLIEEVCDGAKIIRVPVKWNVASQPISPKYGKFLHKVMRDFQPDVIHFDYPNPFAGFFLKKEIKKSKFSGELVLFWHMDIIKQKVLRLFFKGQTKYLLKRADKIIATSPNYLCDTSFLPKVDRNKISIIPLCVGEKRLEITQIQRDLAEEIKKKHGHKKLVFFFGRHVPYKGLKYLLEANKHLDQNSIELLIGGRGPETEKLKKLSADMQNVHFLGRLSDDEINAYLLACDVFAFPSITRNEAFGISLAEALSYGKPSVTFTIKGSGVNFVSPHNVSGLEAPNLDVVSLAKNIQLLATDEELYDKLSRGAKNRCDELFSREAFAKNIRNCLLNKAKDDSAAN